MNSKWIEFFEDFCQTFNVDSNCNSGVTNLVGR